ncbi:uncharacterized protein LOC126318619 [Schistocerca gregaria]|uniref:uncharacterized protein LOC126318619 n=1 Tax=Schistocerca gregaria TaxID=7010 RepID=UPI00211E581A|nr:uncharacterized protein LOC126318619 [Schistocerca gregaria]
MDQSKAQAKHLPISKLKRAKDLFAEMYSSIEMLRDKEIDFHGASVKLDSASELYVRKVDTLHSETNLLAGDLVSGASTKSSTEEQVEEDRDAELNSEFASDTKKKNRKHKTLESNVSNITTKDELNALADSLFHKRSAEFDANGSRNLLLAQLMIHNGYEIVFGSEDLIEDQVEEEVLSSSACESEVNFFKWFDELVSNLLPDDLSILRICPDRLKTELFGDYEIPDINEMAQRWGGELEGRDDEIEFDGYEIGNLCERSPEDILMSRHQLSQEIDQVSQADFGEFDPETLKSEYLFIDAEKQSWVGLKHWKYSVKQSNLKMGLNFSEDESEGGKSASESKNPSKKKKSVFRVDFDAELSKEVEKLLQSSEATSCYIPRTSTEKANSYLNPVETHYDPLSFTELFFPHAVPIGRRMRAATLGCGGEVYPDNVDKEEGGVQFDDIDEDEGAMCEVGYNFDRNDDAGAASEHSVPLSAPDANENPLFATSKFTRLDRTVDLRSLKKNMWARLCTNRNEGTRRLESGTSSSKSFQKLLEEIPQILEPETVKDLSVSYCFVCLLHLANEKQLELKQGEKNQLLIGRLPG